MNTTSSYVGPSVKRNAQAFLPIGSCVKVLPPIYAPHTYDEAGNKIEFRQGQVVEHLGMTPYCGIAIKFDGYANIVDYTNRETANIEKL